MLTMFAGDEQALWALEAGASGSSVRVVLTTREREVLLLLAQGQGVAAIARPLYFSQSTTKSHISRFCEKLGAANRAQAMANALNLGLSPRLAMTYLLLSRVRMVRIFRPHIGCRP